MKVLLDTHAFLWFVNDDSRLSISAKNVMESDNELCLSMASLWEMGIKVSLGKLKLGDPFEAFIEEQLSHNKIQLLSIEKSHVIQLAQLPFHHRDPFDRMIIAQSIVTSLPVVTVDQHFHSYDVEVLW
ncbi:type II toxin-antitoxin system VapC family toxin [Deltaproteobacteria bacterium TL4]